MKQVIDNLREQEYVTSGNVEALRKYIRVKNPNSSGDEISVIFADALHKIIDTRIYQFEEKHRKKIKDDVIRKAVRKREFSINAAEVFSSCLSMKLHEDSYIDSFTLWINQNQSVPVSAETVDKLVSFVEKHEEKYIDENLDEIAGEFEASWAEDETFASLDLKIAEVVQKHISDKESEQIVERQLTFADAAETEWIDKVREFVEASAEELDIEGGNSSLTEALIEATAENNALEIHAPVQEAVELNIEAAAASEPDIGQTASRKPGLDFGKLQLLVHKLAASLAYSLKLIKPSVKLSLAMALPVLIIAGFIFTDIFSDNKIHALQHQDKGKYANIAEEQVHRYLTLDSRVYKKLNGIKTEKDLVLLDGLHEEYKYRDIDRGKLKKWLERKNSMLSDDPYFSAIMSTSKKYDINPLLMFAIVGQEQAFVPKNGTAARKIANNPFNVYGSWESYNTDIYDSSSLAADTIIKSSRNRPVYINTIKWINRKYAEDPNWWNGVSGLFAQMEKDLESKK